MNTLFSFINTFLGIYLLCFFVWALLSWIPQFAPSIMQNPIVSGAQEFLNTIILPWVRLFSFVKPVQVGNAMIDMSSLVAMLVLIVLSKALPSIQGAVTGMLLLPAAVSTPVRRDHVVPRTERSTS